MRAILLLATAWLTLQSCLLHRTGPYVKPPEISYSHVLGFNPEKGALLEWSVISDSIPDEPKVLATLRPTRGLRIKWLGTAGYEIGDDSTTILIDPFVSRPNSWELLTKLEIDTTAVKEYILSDIKKGSLQLVLLSHAHYDHFQDVPYILSQNPRPPDGPLVVGSGNVERLTLSYDEDARIHWIDSTGALANTRPRKLRFRTSTKECLDDSPGVSCRIGTFGKFTVTAFGSDHSSYDYLAGLVIGGPAASRPPYGAIDYKMLHNTSIGYLIEYDGLRIFFTESPIVRHAEEIGKVDILILGIASRMGHNTIVETLARLQPDYVLPTHYDNFFVGLNEFQKFPEKLKLIGVDFSRFERFVRSFERSYAEAARRLLGTEGATLNPQLRLMKLFYYYSLVNLL